MKQFEEEYKTMYLGMYQDIVQQIKNGIMSKGTVEGYLRHLPRRDGSEKWPDEIYEISDKCLHSLYKYSLSTGFIPSNYTYKEFLLL